MAPNIECMIVLREEIMLLPLIFIAAIHPDELATFDGKKCFSLDCQSHEAFLNGWRMSDMTSEKDFALFEHGVAFAIRWSDIRAIHFLLFTVAEFRSENLPDDDFASYFARQGSTFGGLH